MKRKSTLIIAVSELILAMLMTAVILTAEKEWKVIPLLCISLLNLGTYFVSYLYFYSWWDSRVKKSKMLVKSHGKTLALVDEKDYIILN